jgi:steroid 5-alpha reductase family enzyme
MPLWLQVVLVTEVAFLAALVMAVLTRRTHAIFAVGFNVMVPVVALYLWRAPAVGLLGVIGAVMAGVYLFRLNWTILVWTDDTAMSKLDGTLPQPAKLGLAFVLAHSVGLGYCLPFYYISRDTAPLGWWTLLAVAVYVAGTAFHAGGDWQKHRFKSRPDTRGQLLRTGLWSLSRHPNYLGDFLIYLSFALLARHPYAWIAPALNLAQYLFDAIPKNELWASQKYGDAWESYRRSTPMFVPVRLSPRSAASRRES